MIDYINELRKYVGTKPLLLCGAAVILLDSQNRMLMHHRLDNDTWGLPGGAMELGETLEENAARETKEEVGLTCNDLQLVGVYSGPQLYYRFPNGNEVYNVSVVYLCRDFSGEIVVDPAEGKDARFFALDEIPEEISPPIRPVIEDFLKRRNEFMA